MGKIKNKINALALGFLVASNLIPLFGVLFLNWSLFSILFVYWLENIVVGVYALLRMWRAELTPKVPIVITKSSGKTEVYKTSVYISFFLLHYGIFTLVHGVFVYNMFSPSFVSLKWVFVAFISLMISHGISHFKNFIGNKEYLYTSPDKQMMAPYKRVVVMHLTIIAGGFFITTLDEPVGALIILILLKIIVDLLSHLVEHKKTTHVSKRE
ncbi:MAG: DUF6498-containing protein [bacterium]|nr:DUF6498-containing protein [bacterium]